MSEAATIEGVSKPQITLVVAIADNGVIGKDNALPWHLPDDLRYFKRVTLGKPVVMGRKTFESIGKPLPGRRNLVITRQPDLEFAGCEVVSSLQAAIEKCADVQEVVIIGGAAIFAEALPHADTIHLTRVHTTLNGDVYFPDWNLSEWREVSREEHSADAKHLYPFTFSTLQRLRHK